MEEPLEDEDSGLLLEEGVPQEASKNAKRAIGAMFRFVWCIDFVPYFFPSVHYAKESEKRK